MAVSTCSLINKGKGNEDSQRGDNIYLVTEEDMLVTAAC